MRTAKQTQMPQPKLTKLVAAAQAKNLPKIQQLIQQSKENDVNEICQYGIAYLDRYTAETCALREAISNKDLEMVTYLLQAQANVDLVTENRVYFKDNYLVTRDSVLTFAVKECTSEQDAALLQLIIQASTQVLQPVSLEIEVDMDNETDLQQQPKKTALQVAQACKNQFAIQLLSK